MICSLLFKKEFLMWLLYVDLIEAASN